MSKNKVSIFIMVLLLVMAASVVFGATKPNDTDFAYEVYKIGAEKVIGGPIGYGIALAGVGVGAGMLIFSSAVKFAITALVGSGLFLGANGIVSTMGHLY